MKDKKKKIFMFGIVFLITIAFFFINSARTDDFTSLITDTFVQYQEDGVMKDYTTDIHLEDYTPLSFSIKAVIPQGILNTMDHTIAYSLPKQLKVEDIQTNKLYLENNLIHSIGSYEIKNNIMTIHFDEKELNTETDLNVVLVLDTDSSHVIYDTSGTSHISFNDQTLELNKHIETPLLKQMDESIFKHIKSHIKTFDIVEAFTPEPVHLETKNSTDFGPYITTATVSKMQGGKWVQVKEFEDNDQVKVHIGYQLPADIVKDVNDTISYQLPQGLKPIKEETGIVYASNGMDVGTYVIDTEGKITIQFNEKFANGEPFSGYIEFYGTLSQEEAGADGVIIFGGAGGEILIKPTKQQYDLQLSKDAKINQDGTLTYTIQVSTINGTEDTIKIEDQFAKWDTAESEYDKNSYKITKIDKNGIQTDVNTTPVMNNESFTIDHLPKLDAGESYEITYKVTAKPENKDGSGSLTNNVKGTSGHTQKESSHTITLAHSMISKHGGYDQNTGKINWTVTINPDKKDISGYLLQDKIQNGITLPQTFTLKKSDGTSKNISLPYTFPDNSNDTYTIEYQTDAPKENTTITNTGILTKENQRYESSYDVNVLHRDYALTKTVLNKSDDGKKTNYTWQAYITLPDQEITSVTYLDVIKNGTSKNMASSCEHYAILSELRQEILNSIEIRDKDGYLVPKDQLTIDMTFYSDEERKTKVTADDAHVKSFIVIVTVNHKFIGRSLLISYHTIGDIKETEEGIDYYFTNKGVVNNKQSESSVIYNKPRKIIKQGYGKPNGSYNNQYSFDKVNVNYDSCNGLLYYRILFTPDTNEEESIIDILPQGTKLVETELRSDYKTDTYKSHPADRSSPEAVYHLSENYEKNDDGQSELTDLSQYFKYSYDEIQNEIIFTFKPGYNKSEREHPNGTIAIYYAVSIDSDDYWKDLKNESKDYANTIDYNGKKQIQHTEVKRDIEMITKTAKQIVNSTKVEYTVTINPVSKDLDPHSDVIELKDTLGLYYEYSAYFDTSSLKLYEYDSFKDNNRGNLIDSSRYQVQMDAQNNALTITLPDELACVLVYQYVFDVGNAVSPIIGNTVSLQGKYSSTVSNVIDTSYSEAGVIRGKLTIFKVDSKDYSKTLPNAVFKLSQFNVDTKSWEIVNNKLETNSSGEIVFNYTDEILKPDILYRLEETKAPSGYKLVNKPYYFTFYDAKKNQTKEDAINALNKDLVPVYTSLNLYSDIFYIPNNKEISLYVPNEPNSISVKKVWVDSDNKQLANHPSSVDLNLIQNIQEPCGIQVNTCICVKNSWETTERVIDEQVLFVKQGGTLRITLPISSDPSNASSHVVVEGTDHYTISNTQNNWSPIILTVPDITSQTNLKIKLDSNNGKAEYNYDKDYKTTKKVYQTITLNESNNWSYMCENLPKKIGNKDCIYTIEEDIPSGYQVSYMNNDGILEGNITVTNKKLDNSELPDTGGIGTYGYYTIGALLITMTLFVFITNIKRRGHI